VEDPCQRALVALRRGPLPAGDPLAEHVTACPACAAVAAAGPSLVRALDEPSDAAPTAPALDGMLAALEASIDRERGPAAWLRSRPTPVRLAVAALGSGLVPLLVWLAWRRVDAAAHPGDRLALEIAAVLVPAALLLAVGLWPLHRPAWPRWVEPLALGLAVLALLLGPALGPAHHDHPASLGGTGAQLVPRATACLITGTVLALPVLAWLFAPRRGGERAWLLGGLAGLLGALSIFLHCPIVAPVHLLLGHVTVLVPGLLLGAVLLRRAPAPR